MFCSGLLGEEGLGGFDIYGGESLGVAKVFVVVLAGADVAELFADGVVVGLGDESELCGAIDGEGHGFAFLAGDELME